MRSISPALQAKLNSGVTTLARCWIVTRRDGVIMGFTDHDADLTVAGTLCHAGTGLTASEATARLGLQVDGSEIAGALADDSLAEADLAAGHYDAAEIEVHLVDWSEPSLSVLLAKGVLGEVRREGKAFSAEFRSLAHRLNEESGRLYTATCSADLGDAHCAIDLTDPAFRGSGTVAALAGASAFHASGLGAFADGWFTGGKLTFTGGANAGFAVEVKTPSRRARWRADRAVAAPGRAARAGRCLHGHRRLRQALCNLPRPLRQRGQLPRLPAHPGQRFRHRVSGAGEGDALTMHSP